MQNKCHCIRIKRLTADIDSLNIIRVYWCLFVFRLFGFRHETTVKLSPSGHGRHVICWCRNKGLHRGSLYLVRILAGDDRYRVYRDRQDRMIQILWQKKEPMSVTNMLTNLVIKKAKSNSEFYHNRVSDQHVDQLGHQEKIPGIETCKNINVSDQHVDQLGHQGHNSPH